MECIVATVAQGCVGVAAEDDYAVSAVHPDEQVRPRRRGRSSSSSPPDPTTIITPAPVDRAGGPEYAMAQVYKNDSRPPRSRGRIPVLSPRASSRCSAAAIRLAVEDGVCVRSSQGLSSTSTSPSDQ